MFGKSKEVKRSYKYRVEYCIIGLMTQPSTLTIDVGKEPLKQLRYNGGADMLFSSNKLVRKTNNDLFKVMSRIFESYAYMDLAEFKKRIVIIKIEGVN